MNEPGICGQSPKKSAPRGLAFPGRAALACWLVAGAVTAAPIRNVILCIGDGMGPGQVQAAHDYAGTNLVFETFPFRARVTTYAAGGALTDSAAAATAIAAGVKVDDGVISLAIPGDTHELETLLEHFKRLDKSTGLVTTSYLTDATPAGFGAHTTSRYNHSEIAWDYLLQTRPNVLFGGGEEGLYAADAQSEGYRVVTDAASLLAVVGGPDDHVAGLFGSGPLPYVADGLNGLPSLAQMTGVALERLSRDPDGFFLMVEGGRIDHAGHANDLWRNVTETLAFSEAVGVIAAWAGSRADTLVLVTADHETGGLNVLADNGAGHLPSVSWSTGGHSSTPVPVYGQGVHASMVTQLVDNTELRLVTLWEGLMPALGIGVQRVSGTVAMTHWAVGSGDVCRVEYTPALGASPPWQLGGSVTATSTRVSVAVTNAPGCARGFYRMISGQE